MESTPSTANTATKALGPALLLSAEEIFPESTCSSFLTQFVLFEISAGQTTRWKFALWKC
jgi:hypothetical protein